MGLKQVGLDLSGLDGYWMVGHIEVIDVGIFKIFGVREISDLDKLNYGETGESGYGIGDRALTVGEWIGNAGYICTGEGQWKAHGNAATYLPVMRERLKLVEVSEV